MARAYPVVTHTYYIQASGACLVIGEQPLKFTLLSLKMRIVVHQNGYATPAKPTRVLVLHLVGVGDYRIGME